MPPRWQCFPAFAGGETRQRMAESPVLPDQSHRRSIEKTIVEHRQIRELQLHAVNCCSNDCHLAVTAGNHDGEQVRNQLNARCVRPLKQQRIVRGRTSEMGREHWWTAKQQRAAVVEYRPSGSNELHTRSTGMWRLKSESTTVARGLAIRQRFRSIPIVQCDVAVSLPAVYRGESGSPAIRPRLAQVVPQ